MSPNTVRQLQKKLYEKAKSVAQDLSNGDNFTIIEYSKKFEKSLPNKFKKISKENLLTHIADAKVILYGDFHTLKQSQKGFVQLGGILDEFKPQRKCLIAMETFKSSDQNILDMFMQKKITEEDFLQKINYDKTWGFPWQNYKKIVQYAAAKRVPLFGINSNANSGDTLLMRDEFFAEKLAKLAVQFFDYQILCIVGEYHLADQQLPEMLEHKLSRVKKLVNRKTIRIVSNIDQYYFSLNFPSESTVSHYLYLKKNLFCLMNTPPWIKWQSYILWEELRNEDSQLNAKEGLYNEIKIDLDYHIFSLVSELIVFFNFPRNPEMLNKFHLVFGSPEKIIKEAKKQNLISMQSLKTAFLRLIIDEFFYVSKTKTILLTKVSLNNLSESAGQFLYDTVSVMRVKKNSLNDFYQRIVRFSLGTLCSKIINPKRKIIDYDGYIDITQKQYQVSKKQREIAREAVKFHKWMLCRVEKHDGYISHHLKRTVTIDEKEAFEVSKSLGKIIGVKLYNQTLKDSSSLSTVKAFFQGKPRNKEIWHIVVDMYRYFSTDLIAG